MRKVFAVLFALALVAVLAAPAMADVKISGFYRAKGYVSNFKALGAETTLPVGETIRRDGVDFFGPGENLVAADPISLVDTSKTYTYVEQRMRFKFEGGDENVKAVWFVELDPTFGVGNFDAARNQGGALGADQINLETKNAYLWFKVPDTSWQFTVGLQNVSDSYAGVIFGGADMSGVFATFKFDPVDVRLGWANWFEGDVGQADDIQLWLAEVKFVPTKDAKLGINFYMIHDGGTPASPGAATGDDTTPGGVFPTDGLTADTGAGDAVVYIPGVDFTMKLGPGSLNAFFLYELGTVGKNTANELDVAGWALDARYDMNLGAGKLFVEGLYVTGDDDDTDGDYNGIVTAGNYVGSQDYFSRTDMQILHSNIDDLSTNQPLMTNMNGYGSGIIHLAAGYSHKLSEKLTGKLGVGYSTFTEDPGTGDKGIGIEVNGNVNYAISKGLDLGFYAAYVSLGDFYDNPGFGDPDNPYDMHFRLNYAF